jgi:hypothetical protein
MLGNDVIDKIDPDGSSEEAVFRAGCNLRSPGSYPGTGFGKPFPDRYPKEDKIIQEIKDKLETVIREKKIDAEKADQARKQLNDFLNKVTNIKRYPLIRRDDCWKWAKDVSEGIGSTPGVFEFKTVSWDYMFYTRFLKWHDPNNILDHAAIELKIGDNIYYFDDGWWGGLQHVFKPEQIPWQFVEPGIIDSAVPTVKPPKPLSPRPN